MAENLILYYSRKGENYWSGGLKELKKGNTEIVAEYIQKAVGGDLDGYDHVFVCGPCWWGTFPMAVFTQLEKLDWTGKKVMAVMTHEGSGLGGSERDLKKICQGATFGKGFSVAGHDAANSEAQVAAWAKSQV